MHRLISAKNIYKSTFHGISLPGNSTHKSTPIAEIKCTFCRRVLLGSYNTENQFIRHQSTKTASALRSSRKKAKHKIYKKYGELLEVGQTAMTETKVSISKLHASHLSKIASSPVSLGQLHQLTSKPDKIASHNTEVDPELLRSVREKILKKSTLVASKEILLEDDQCALVYTNHKLSCLENRIKTKQYIDMVKESYYNFRKATLYDQRLQDLRYAINEGLNQEFDLNMSESKNSKLENDLHPQLLPKSPHAIFRELFVDNHLDSYDHELMTHITNMQTQGMVHPALEDICDDPAIHGDIVEAHEEIDIDHTKSSTVKSLKIKKAKEAIFKKKKARREKRRALLELNMKEDMKDLVRRGKQEALHRVLNAHLHLLCSLNMVQEGRQILQHFRQRSTKGAGRLKVTDVKIYNILLHGYASTGELENIKELLSFMSEDTIEPNAQSYAAIFECVERTQLEDKLVVLNYYRKQMQDKGITLNDIMDKSKFLYDQREVVINAIRRLQPGFEPEYTPPILDYNCPLLENLELENVEAREGLRKSPAEGVVTVEEILRKGREQMQIEIKGDIEVKNIDVKDELSESVKFCRKRLEETENEWRGVIKEAFIRNLGTLKSQSFASYAAITLYPYLKVLEVDQFVDLIMVEISKLVDGSESYSPTLKLLQRDLGTQVYHKYQIEQYRRNGVLAKIEEIYAKYCEWYVRRGPVADSPLAYNCRQAWQALAHAHRTGAELDMEEAPWPVQTRQNIGKFLYNVIINDVKIDVNMFKPKAKEKKLPAVYKVHRPWGRLVRLELKPHPVLARLWTGAARAELRVRAALAPTACPPRPWPGPRAGAYLLTTTPLVRMPLPGMGQLKHLDQAPPGALYPVLDSLNQLSEVPWVINKPILDLQLQIFRSGGNKKLDIPPPSSLLDPLQFGDSKPADATAAFKRRVALNRARAEMHSLWCDMLYKLSLANHFRDAVFWLPHNMDFRGRVYACPPHVSVLGADAARALLQFARARPLGPRGLRWLTLHAVNLTGTMKKTSIEDRLKYADSIMEKILDSADRPLDGEGWWMKSEEPWQTLACCKEIANALRSPNVEEYMCSFPVHQDGSCNGLQHYAALGGDAAGAAAVNLAPRGSPMDVYSAVAALVEQMRARDAAAGVPAAQVLESFVRRKVIKQTVMTTVYGVTRFGARLQIAKQLKDIDDFPKEHVWACSQYLTSKTFDSLREMFTSTKLIQDWFTECAKVISGVCGESVEWVTPLGLPVVQPYYRRAAPAAHAAAALEQHQRPCTMKQRNAFPPNFIHSLDSSHMMLTGLHCQAAGFTFVSVHDCFWTHPHTVDTMNQICREQFVALHSQPILEDLSDFFVKRYSYDVSELDKNSAGAANKKRVNSLLRKVPGKGEFDLKSVLDSVYFFS